MSTATTDSATDVEDLGSFRSRLHTWLAANMPPSEGNDSPFGGASQSDEEELADVQRNRNLQRTLFDGGFAGITYPKEYGGQGLTRGHQQVFNEEIVGYQYPARIQVPTFQPCATVLLEFGSHEQKLAHIPAILKGEEIWMQFLSEPSGGSDVAGALTTALRDGDEWVVNGNKIWTSGAWWADWALCLARTNWDVQKHRGLSVFMVKIHQPGIEVRRIEMLNGRREFCEEFITDLRIPDSDRIGDVDDGWTVGTRWMFYEKSFGISFEVTRPAATADAEGEAAEVDPLLKIARDTGRLEDPVVRELVGEGHALALVNREADRRIGAAVSTGVFSQHAAGLSKVLHGTTSTRLANIRFELGGPSAAVWTDDDADLGELGSEYLVRQANHIGGGTVEMSRNVVSERFMGMPRERSSDREIPFRDIPRGPAK